MSWNPMSNGWSLETWLCNIEKTAVKRQHKLSLFVYYQAVITSMIHMFKICGQAYFLQRCPVNFRRFFDFCAVFGDFYRFVSPPRSETLGRALERALWPFLAILAIFSKILSFLTDGLTDWRDGHRTILNHRTLSGFAEVQKRCTMCSAKRTWLKNLVCFQVVGPKN